MFFGRGGGRSPVGEIPVLEVGLHPEALKIGETPIVKKELRQLSLESGAHPIPGADGLPRERQGPGGHGLTPLVQADRSRRLLDGAEFLEPLGGRRARDVGGDADLMSSTE